MKTILSGKAHQLSECVAFAVNRCKAHGLDPNDEPTTTDTGVAIRSRSESFSIKISVHDEDLIIESKAKFTPSVIMSDPAPPLYNLFLFGNLFGWISDKLSHGRVKSVFQSIHSEIKHRFGN